MSTQAQTVSVAPSPAPQVAIPVVSGVAPLTEAEFKAALPDKVKKSVSQALIDEVNKIMTDPGFFEHYRDNLISYTKVMADGKYKIQGYVDAVKYVSHKLMGASNIEAYSKTFPDKIAQFAAAGVSAKDISSYCAAYNKGQLVNALMAQTMIPVHIYNQDYFQKALNTQFELMNDYTVSPKVRSDAANSLLTHLKPPEVTKVELDISHKEDGSIQALRTATLALANQQRLQIGAGVITAQDAAHSKIVLAESDVVDAEVK